MILVVEDNADDSFLLTRQLARADLKLDVQVVGDGKDAWDLLCRRLDPPLAIFLDLHLPGISGVELLRKIRGDRRLRHLSVVVMTGSLNPRDVDICTDLGVAAYLPKPVSLDTFVKILGHLPSRVALSANFADN